MATPTKVLVLGSGWVGKRLATYLRSERGCSVIETHRTAVSSSSPGTEVVEFDLAREETWKNLPLTVNKVVITFPLRTEAQSSNTSSLVKFTRTYLQQCGADCIVAYGSTRRYVCPAPHAEVDESSELDDQQVRVVGEKRLLQELPQAVLMVLAGIWGEDRQPENWFKKGRIKNGNKYLNLIHITDIVRITALLLWHGAAAVEAAAGPIEGTDGSCSAREVVVSDGTPYYDAALAQLFGVALDEKEADTASKRLLNNKLNAIVGSDYSFVRLCGKTSHVE